MQDHDEKQMNESKKQDSSMESKRMEGEGEMSNQGH